MSLRTKMLVWLGSLVESWIERQSTKEGPGEGSGNDEASEPGRIRFLVFINMAAESEECESEDEGADEDVAAFGEQHVEMFAHPTAELIREQVRAIDWTDDAQQAHVAVGHADGGKVHNLHLKGALESPNVDGYLRAYWLGPLFGYVRSPRLNDIEQGIELLLMFLSNEQGLMEIVKAWEAVEDAEDAEDA